MDTIRNHGQPMSAPLFVITGGPGSRKTSLIAALGACGLRTMSEAGRAIIRDQTVIGGTTLP